ncbi:hypothetical protein [Microcystis phage MaeS]|nr:hypothetical protein [Microcystis phage MaeS]
MEKEYKLVGRNGQVIKLSGNNIFGLWCYLHSKGYKYQR